jgi:hypothetical protein
MSDSGHTDEIASIEAAILRIEQERLERDAKVDARLRELEDHGEWLEGRVGLLVFLLAWVPLGHIVARWFGDGSLVTVLISFIAALLAMLLFVYRGGPPLPWRYLRHLPHLRNRRE